MTSTVILILCSEFAMLISLYYSMILSVFLSRIMICYLMLNDMNPCSTRHFSIFETNILLFTRASFYHEILGAIFAKFAKYLES